MPLWPDIATWRGPTPNTSGSISDHMYVVVHTADGSFEGTIAWQRNASADVSSHFVVAKDGRIAQMLDTNAKPWTQKAGNPYSISIENEGNENTPLTAYQIEANARILARGHQVHGIPLQLTGKVGTRGLGHHSMGAESGVDWGHSLCPGAIIKGQKPAILARAQEIVGGGVSAASTTEGSDMPLVVKFSDNPAVFLSDGITSRWLPDGASVGFILALAKNGWTDLGNVKKDPANPQVCVLGPEQKGGVLGRIVGPVPAGYEAYADAQDTQAIVTGVLQGLADDPSSEVTQSDIDSILAAIASNPDAVRAKLATDPLH